MRLNRWPWIYFPEITELKAMILITFMIIIVTIIAVVLSWNISLCKLLILLQHMTVLYSECCLFTVKCYCRRRVRDSFNILQICIKMLANCFMEKVFILFYYIFKKYGHFKMSSGCESCSGCEVVWAVQRNSDILQIVTFCFAYKTRFVFLRVCVFSVVQDGLHMMLCDGRAVWARWVSCCVEGQTERKKMPEIVDMIWEYWRKNYAGSCVVQRERWAFLSAACVSQTCMKLMFYLWCTCLWGLCVRGRSSGSSGRLSTSAVFIWIASHQTWRFAFSLLARVFSACVHLFIKIQHIINSNNNNTQTHTHTSTYTHCPPYQKQPFVSDNLYFLRAWISTFCSRGDGFFPPSSHMQEKPHPHNFGPAQ